MPRTPRKVPGRRKYANYSKETLKEALRELNSGRLNYRQASDKYGISLGTLSRKVNNKHMNNPGHPTLLSTSVENSIVEAILAASDWGYPFENEDIKLIVKSYLDRTGRRIPQFKNNKPGDDWMSLFMKRQKHHLKRRLCDNIKRSRAAVSRETIGTFFDNIEIELNGVPPSNLINYDETCFIDDPGKTKVLIRRSAKHPDRIMDFSKTATSVMFAVAGDGVMLPPYVVYKAENVWSTWTEGGPEGCLYNRTASGWFDQTVFEDWFLKVIIPYLRKKDGNKAVIGDNLASHLSINVIKKCTEMGIKFIFLPPNSTHIMQPLDVSCFRPMKGAWRKVLLAWRKRNKGPLRKDIFPRLLKATLEKISGTNPDNIKSGFLACGLHPVNRNKILDKFPQEQPESTTEMAKAVLNYLKEARFGSQDKPKLGRKKKLDVPPGQSVTEEMMVSGSGVTEEMMASGSGLASTGQDHFEEGETLREQSDLEETENVTNQSDEDHSTIDICDIQENDFLLVKFLTVKNNTEYFIGKVIKIGSENVICSFLRKSSKTDDTYIFPNVEDVSEINVEQIIRKMTLKASRRNRYVFY